MTMKYWALAMRTDGLTMGDFYRLKKWPQYFCLIDVKSKRMSHFPSPVPPTSSALHCTAVWIPARLLSRQGWKATGAEWDKSQSTTAHALPHPPGTTCDLFTIRVDTGPPAFTDARPSLATINNNITATLHTAFFQCAVRRQYISTQQSVSGWHMTVKETDNTII